MSIEIFVVLSFFISRVGLVKIMGFFNNLTN